MLGVDGRCGGRDDAAAQPAREPHAGAHHIGTGGGEQRQRFVVVADLDANVGEDDFRRLFDERKAFFADDLVGLHDARQVRDTFDSMRSTQRLTPCAAT